MNGTTNRSVRRANVVIFLLIAALGVLSIDKVAERFGRMLYDDASSFIRVDPKPGWVATPIIVEQNRPIGIVASGRVSTPRLQRAGGRPTGDRDDESRATLTAARRTPQFLSASGVIVSSADKWNSTRFLCWQCQRGR